MTLSEACVAAAILTTALAVAAPSFMHAHQAYLLNSTARAIAGSLHMARIAAVTQNADCRISVPSAALLSIECDQGQWQQIEGLTLPHGMVLSANARPTFHARGNVSPAGTLTVCNRFGLCLRVIVNVSGRVRIQ
jgi:hypothetical protein